MMPHNLQTMRPSYDVDRPAHEETRMFVTVSRKPCAKCGKLKYRTGLLCNCDGCGDEKCECGMKNAAAVTKK